jgi:hypothetical protein
MYYVMLAPGNTEFVTAVQRGGLRFRTKRLDEVVAALEAAQKVRSAQTFAALLNALHVWRTNEPNEYANRGGTQGVAYRLWMETKQHLENRFNQNVNTPNPPMPGGCPGDTLLGVFVPPGEGHTEICHGFAYRWFIAAGEMAENPVLPAVGGSYNALTVTPVLYPLGYAGYPAARVGGVMQLQPGDVVAMFVLPAMGGAALLGHSLIAETPTTWFSANNAGTFGVGTGRSRIDTTQNFGVFAGNQVGWIGNGNQWMRPDGIVGTVVYRR